MSRSRSRHCMYSFWFRDSKMLQPSVLRMHMAWAKWWRSMTLPSEEYRAAKTELEVTWKLLLVPRWSRSWQRQAMKRARHSRSLKDERHKFNILRSISWAEKKNWKSNIDLVSYSQVKVIETFWLQKTKLRRSFSKVSKWVSMNRKR